MTHEPNDDREITRQSPRSTATTVVSLAIFFLTTVLIVGVVYVFVADVLSPDAPRSAVERELQRFEAASAADPSNPEPHARYARALVSAGQYERADEILSSAVIAMPEAPVLLVEQARLEWARGGDGALPLLADASALIDTIRAEYEADLAARGIGGDITLPEADAFTQAQLLEAAIYEEAEDWPSAIAAYTRLLEENPTMANALTARGDVYLIIGDLPAARADFSAALRYIPDFEPALAGLNAAGGEQ